MVNIGMRLAVIYAALIMSSCSTVGRVDPLEKVWDNPSDYNGITFSLYVYPYDLHGNENRYIMCTEPCDDQRASEWQSVIVPNESGKFDNYNGERKVFVNIKFDGYCFTDGAVCLLDHRPFVFIEQ